MADQRKYLAHAEMPESVEYVIAKNAIFLEVALDSAPTSAADMVRLATFVSSRRVEPDIGKEVFDSVVAS